MFNEVVLSGTIATEPEKKMSDKGNVWCHFLVRTRRMKKKDGTNMGPEYQNYIPVTLFGKGAEDVIEYGKKGSDWIGKGFLAKNTYDKAIKDNFGNPTGETQKVSDLQVQWMMTEVIGAPKPWDKENDLAKSWDKKNAGNKESKSGGMAEDSPF